MSETFIVISFLYFLFIILLAAGLLSLKKHQSTSLHSVSIIVPARNEEKRIEECLQHLLKQNHPDYEIIVINDRSEDKTRNIIKTYSDSYDNVHLIDIKEVPCGFSPKKFAITKGIETAKGEIILTTDADCRPPETWASAIASHFDEKTVLVAGFSPVFLKNKSPRIFSSSLYLDSLSLAGIAAGSIALNIPLTCTGRNLAYRKNMFQSSDGFRGTEKIPSGDDDLLLHKIARFKKKNIRFAARKEAQVPSIRAILLRDFFNQRIRHASKFLLHPFRVKLVSSIVFLFNLSLICALIMSITAIGNMLYLLLAIASIKFFLEFLFLMISSVKLRTFFPPLTFFILFFLHPFYVVVFGPLGLFRKYNWK